jgi:hypothetical protein
MHTHLHFFFFILYNDSLPNMLYYYVPFFSIPVDPFQLSYNLSLFFTSIHYPTFHIPHSMSSRVARSIAEPKFFYESYPLFREDPNTLIYVIFGHYINKLLIFEVLIIAFLKV